MTDNIEKLFKEPDIWGPEVSGHSVFWEGRRVPNLVAYDRGDRIEFVLDGRMSWEFPRTQAFNALSFMANAMAIGAGYPCFAADHKMEAFASKVVCLGFDEGESP